MKKYLGVLAAVILLAGAGLAHAEGMNGGMMMGNGMKDNDAQPSMMGKGMMGHGMMGMGMDHKMMGPMMQKQVIATSDGGVVVVSENTLTKYDKNLNLVKTVELKGCKDCMGKMDGSKGKCPMMGGMKHDQDGDDDDVPAKVDEHAGHHAEKK